MIEQRRESLRTKIDRRNSLEKLSVLRVIEQLREALCTQSDRKNSLEKLHVLRRVIRETGERSSAPIFGYILNPTNSCLMSKTGITDRNNAEHIFFHTVQYMHANI